MTGLVQGAGAPPSMEQVKVAGSTVEWKPKVAELELVGFAGPLSITVSATVLANE